MDELLDRLGRVARPLLMMFGVFWLGLGLWAFVAPKSFFDALAEFDPYNRHFIHDVGSMQIDRDLGGRPWFDIPSLSLAAVVGLAALVGANRGESSR